VKHLVGNGSHFYEKLSDAITNRYPLRKYQKYRLIAGLNKTVIFTLIRNIRYHSSWQTIKEARSQSMVWSWVWGQMKSHIVRGDLPVVVMSETRVCGGLW